MKVPKTKVASLKLLLVLLSTTLGCHNWDEFPWVTIPSPDGDHEIRITVAEGGIGGNTTFVRLHSLKRESLGPREFVIYKIHGCQVFYAFWLDGETIEIQLQPNYYPCAHHEGTITNVPGFSVLETTPASTAKEAVARTVR